MLRHRGSDMYDFPGGRMEWGEAPLETLNRELSEELTYSLPYEPILFDIWNYIAPDQSRHSVQLQYLLKVTERPHFTVTENAVPLWLSKAFFIEHWTDDRDRVERMFLP